MIDISRAICRTPDGVGAAGSGYPRWARAFEDFLRLETAVPLLVDHGALIDSRGVIADIGTGAPFAALTSPLPGLLCLDDVGRADGHGDQLLYDIELMLLQT